MQRLQITTLAAQDISAPLLAATYTADADRELLVQVYLSGLAGNGVYRACMTKQLLGAGAVHQSPTSAAALGAITTLFLPGLPIPVQDTDVVRVYVQGLAADVAVATNVEVFDVTAAEDVWDELLTPRVVPDSAAVWLKAAGGAADPWLTPLPGAYAPGSAGFILANCCAGVGSVERIYPVTDSTTGLPISGVYVWVSTDAAGVNIIASGYTDVFGNVSFWLDAGTYYFWAQRAGYTFPNPDQETFV